MRAQALVEATQSLVAVVVGTNYGSGFVIGHGEADCSVVITAAHVLGRHRVADLTVRLGRRFQSHKAFVVALEHEVDLAILQTEEQLPVPSAQLAESMPELYEGVYVAGCPARTPLQKAKQYFGTVVDCRITSLDGSNGDDPVENDPTDFQLSIPIGGGMSGGMVLNDRGLVVGVPTNGDDKAFVSFAASLKVLRAFIERHTTTP